MQSIRLILCALYLGPLLANSQNNSPTPFISETPSPPWVAAPPDKAQWKITLRHPKTEVDTEGNPAIKAQRQLQEIRAVKVGKVKRDILAYSDGFKEENWYVDKFLLMPVQPGSSEIMICSNEGSGSQETFDPINSVGFAGVGWIKGADFHSTEPFLNVKCDHYVRDLQAWIDAKTKLPVAYQYRGTLYVYTFEPPPVSLSLPPAYQRVYDAYQKKDQHKHLLMRDLGGPRY